MVHKNDPSVADANSVFSTGNPRYFFTVEAYEQIKQNNYNDYVRITTDTKQVYSQFEVRWHVRVWKQASQPMSPTNPGAATPLRQGDGVRVYVRNSYRTAQAANLEIGDIVQASAGSSSSFPLKTATTFPYYVDNTNSSNSEIFYFNVKPKKANVFAEPDIYVKLAANSSENPNQYDLEVLPYSTTIPAVKWTTAKASNPVPKIVKEQAYREHLIALDRCSTPNRWAAVVKLLDINPNGANWYIYYYPLEADSLSTAQLESKIQKRFIGYDSTSGPNAPTGPDKISHFNVATLELNKIKTDTCGAAVDNPNAPDDGITQESSKPVQIASDTRTNPPNHKVTRSVSHWAKIRSDIEKQGEFKGKRANYSINKKDVDLLAADASGAGKLGMIFQDAESAKALNLDTKLPWGFRFIYNPTSINYTTAMDTSIDWMLADKDPANYIGGNVAVGMTLYLNRVADMTELAGNKGVNSDYGPAGVYPRALRPEEVQGILHRGTEYDLEFLYRVVNGDPRPSTNSLLTYTVGGNAPLTSDFGYITGTPVWLKIHNNLRYKVSIASLTVNHVIFNELMIPMFSTVDIQMIRYPVISDTNSEIQDAFSKEKTKYIANISKEAEAAQ